MVRGDFPVQRSVFDLFRFADEARDGRALVQYGYDPWWTEPGFKIAMFRPLSSALIALDVHLFGLDARGFHLHSLAWLVALLAATALFFSELLPPAAACIAIVLFAAEEGVTPPAIWLANRSTLVSCTFGFLGLWLHARNRARPSGSARYLEGALFTLALGGGEYAFSVLAYVLAFEFVTRKPWAEQLRGALPAVLPALAWLIVSAALGYGVHGSAFYLSPFGTPREFFHAVGERVPVLFADLTLGIPARGWVHATAEEGAWQAFDGILGMSGLGIAALWAARGLPKQTGESVLALFLGSALSTLPGGSALPEDRLLASAAAGTAGVFGVLVVEAIRRRPAWLRNPATAGASPRKTIESLLALLIVPVIAKVHGLEASRHSRETAQWILNTAPALRRWALDAEIPDAPERTQCIVLDSVNDFTTAANLPWLRRLDGLSMPRCYLRLSEARFVHQITRIASNVIEVSIFGSEFERVFVDSLYRRAKQPLRTGYVVRVPGFTAEVLATVGPNPWLMRFTFDRDLDDGSFVFLHPYPDRLRQFQLPPIGDKIRLPGPSVPPI